MSTLYESRISLKEEPGDKFTIFFDCQAEDADHAQEQAENAYTGCEIVMVHVSDVAFVCAA
jgi:hypothetical protein